MQIALKNKAPEQDAQKVLLMVERYTRGMAAMEPWATKAKECVDFVEGKQWSTEDLQRMDNMGRPALTINKIAPLVKLMLGYHRNNRVDDKFLPGHDGTGTEQTANVLTHLAKQIDEHNGMDYRSTEVFLDGMLSGRGYFDSRLSFDENTLGEQIIRTKDPFSIVIDPDGDSYDLNESCTWIAENRWVSYEEIEHLYGEDAALLVSPLVHRSGYAGLPSSLASYEEEITPWRTFGGEYDRPVNGFEGIESYLANAVDYSRKNIRLVDMQHYVRVRRKVIEDLETGYQYEIPDHFDRNKIEKIMAWAEEQYWLKGKKSPLRLVERVGKRPRWTTLIGDIIVYDAWSPYSSFTITGYFPWFRRGKTRGFVDDLIDPQREVNKRRSAETDIVTRSAHSGWQYHKDSMSEENKAKMEREGASPGYNNEWQGESGMKPSKIESGSPPMAMERLENKAAGDLKEISNINESMLGIVDKVQSGRAIEARQRQSAVGVQTFMDNFSRTRELLAYKKLEIIQSHYTQERMVRILGTDGKMQSMSLNQTDPVGRILNDVTVGRYAVTVEEVPMSASFMSGQFEDMMDMIEKGILPVEISADLVVDMSSVPQKEALKRRIKAYMAAQGIPTGDDMTENQTGQPMQPGMAPAQGGLVVDAQGNPVGQGGQLIPQ